ncbi:hypothetical protein [Zobellia nedashkovskayae]|uniref:hypothetical protein n=1 Tax=Zobellia nedashkovskayae TaxID=2779510 RepID=UPI00188BCE16|nr:hypothetical protein [Zobellia nedashkovskayae]
MKKLIFSTKFILISFLASLIFSCSLEDGVTGPAGPPGANGSDGNANVQTYLYDISTETGGNIAVDVPELTQDVIDNDLIIGYLKTLNGSDIPVPAVRYLDAGYGRNFMDIGVEIDLGRFWLYFHEVGSNASATFGAGYITKLKVVIVKSNSTTEKSGAATLRAQLKRDGVNLSDYNAVMEYFDLKH